MIDKIWINFKLLEKEKTKRFHGKPDKILPLINSNIPNETEKINANEIFLFFLNREKMYKAHP